jgi:hypothetical protein
MWRAFGAAVDTPPGVRTALLAVFGPAHAEALDRTRVVEHSLYARLHVRAVATTRRRRIYLRGSGADFFANPELMLHEYCHVLSQWEPQTLTVARYVLEWLRRGYWDNRFEIEAREFAQDHLMRLRALLSRTHA